MRIFKSILLIAMLLLPLSAASQTGVPPPPCCPRDGDIVSLGGQDFFFLDLGIQQLAPSTLGLIAQLVEKKGNIQTAADARSLPHTARIIMYVTSQKTVEIGTVHGARSLRLVQNPRPADIVVLNFKSVETDFNYYLYEIKTGVFRRLEGRKGDVRINPRK